MLLILAPDEFMRRSAERFMVLCPRIQRKNDRNGDAFTVLALNREFSFHGLRPFPDALQASCFVRAIEIETDSVIPQMEADLLAAKGEPSVKGGAYRLRTQPDARSGCLCGHKGSRQGLLEIIYETSSALKSSLSEETPPMCVHTS